MAYMILTDSSCDLSQQMLEQLQVKAVCLTVHFRGAEHENDQLDIPAFYRGMREGEVASTSAVNPEKWSAVMEPLLQQGQDLLILAFSSGLSNTHQAACIAAEELRSRYPERTIVVVDTLCASLGQGLLVYTCAKQRLEGRSLDEVANFAEREKLHVCHWFTVQDLHYLKRGGRISAATAVFGSLLSIKPVLHMDNAGHLVNVSKARGRRASIEAMFARMCDLVEHPEGQTVFISHGDCLDDAQSLAKLVRDRFAVREVIIGDVGPVIGAHSGPGTLALFFFGRER